MSYRKMICFEAVTPSPRLNRTYHWARVLTEISKRDDFLDTEVDLSKYAVPVNAFKDPVLEGLTDDTMKGLMLEIFVYDYKDVIRKKVLWVASVQRVVGLRLLLRYVAMDPEESLDFWVNAGSKAVGHLGRNFEMPDVIVAPPYDLRRRNSERPIIEIINEIHTKLQDHNYLSFTFEEARSNMFRGKFRIGQRIELLDTGYSTRVRPARVKNLLGRRIFVQVMPEDCERDHIGEVDRQYDSDYWIDERSLLIFHVGWAALNGYECYAREEYLQHAESIASALINDVDPDWEDIDVRPEYIHEDTMEYDFEDWKEGMKFELLDPLSEKFRELQVAHVDRILTNGYMVVKMDDGRDADCFPIHYTSKYLFPAGYADKHKIPLAKPEGVAKFSWASYLKKHNAIAATADMFVSENVPETMHLFKTGAKLEATDMCGNYELYPATVVVTLGRLVLIHYDGWDASDDALVDAESTEIFPLGYAELHGYHLNSPRLSRDDGLIDEKVYLKSNQEEKIAKREFIKSFDQPR